VYGHAFGDREPTCHQKSRHRPRGDGAVDALIESTRVAAYS
jgi:hypothetical protein